MEEKTEYVYLLGAEGTDKVKVGRTRGAIDARVAQLQTGNPFRIVERSHIATLYASKVESYLHALLAGFRGETGEWFEVPDDVLEDKLNMAQAYAAHLDETSGEILALAQGSVDDRDEQPNDDDKKLHLELLDLYAESKRIQIEIEKREDALKLRVRTASALGAIASWKPVETTRLDQQRLKQERPELFSEFSSVTRSRRFVVNRNIEDQPR